MITTNYSVCYAGNWNFNPFTGKLDYYESGVTNAITLEARTAPGTPDTDEVIIYLDEADCDLKAKYADGSVVVIAAFTCPLAPGRQLDRLELASITPIHAYMTAPTPYELNQKNLLHISSLPRMLTHN